MNEERCDIDIFERIIEIVDVYAKENGRTIAIDLANHIKSEIEIQCLKGDYPLLSQTIMNFMNSRPHPHMYILGNGNTVELLEGQLSHQDKNRWAK